MNLVAKFFVLSLTILCLGQSASAVQIANKTQPKGVDNVTTDTVERGGTVDAVSTDKKTMTVDGRSYVFAGTSVVVHTTSGKDTQVVGSIRPGMKIRFNTSKKNYVEVDRIIEVWIIEAGKQANKK